MDEKLFSFTGKNNKHRNFIILLLKELKYLNHSQLDSWNNIRMNNRRREDLDIYERATDYLTPEFRYDYYSDILNKGLIYIDGETEDIPTEEEFVSCFNHIEEILFPESKFVF